MDTKLNFSSSDAPIVTTNLSGVILYMNNEAIKGFPSLSIGKEIFEIIDRDSILKSSMSSGVTIRATKSTKYNYAIVKAHGNNFAEAIELKFIRITDLAGEVLLKESFNHIVENDKKEKIKLHELIEEIVKGIKNLKGHAYKSISFDASSNIEVCCESTRLAALIVSMIFLLNEIDSVSPVSIKAELCDGNVKLECSIEHKFPSIPMGKVDISKIFPHLVSRISFIDALSEEMNVKNEIIISNGKLTTISIIPQVSNKLVKVYAGIFAHEQIEEIISALYITRI